MSGNNLAVKISADVTDLQVKFAVAQAEVRALTSEMNALARQSAQGIIDPAGEAKLQEVAGDLLKARTEAASLKSEFAEMKEESLNVGESLEELGAKFTSALQVSGIAVAAEAVEKLGEMIERLGERAVTIRTSSDVLGVTGEQFQAMEIAAEDAGVGIDVLTRAAEKMSVSLNEARQGSSQAIEKMLSLGLTLQQIHDPAFKLNDVLETLHERLISTESAQETMNELMKELGPRAALAAEAIKKYDGSAEGVKEVMEAINGVTDEQTKKLSEAKAWWGELAASVSNSASKIFVAVTNMMPHTTGTGVIKEMIDQEVAEDRRGADEEQEINKEVLQQEMENAKAGVAAFKQGTEQRLEQLRTYAEAAKQYYGSDSVDAVIKANNEIIAEQRAVTEAQAQSAQKEKSQLQDLLDFGKQLDDEIMVDRQRIALESAKAQEQYVKESKKQMDELVNGTEEMDTEIRNKHAQILKEMAAENEKHAKEQAKSWQGMVGEIENVEGSLVSNVLNRRKSLTQSLMQMGGELVQREIANDLKAFTTKMLLNDRTKAMEQGGLLYHAMVELQKMAATARSQSAQTGATLAGNSARAAANAGAAATEKATSADLGSKTVLQDAAKAFSGTYAAVAQIPYVGWILAPAAGAAAYAAVAAYEGLASLDTGTNYVPHDMLAQIHEGEAVVPKQYNPAAGGTPTFAGGGYSEEHNYRGDMHIHAMDTQDMARAFRRNGSSLIQAAARAYRRGAR